MDKSKEIDKAKVSDISNIDILKSEVAGLKIELIEQKAHRDAARDRLKSGRDYLMQVKPDDLTVEDCLEAFGWSRDGY